MDIDREPMVENTLQLFGRYRIIEASSGLLLAESKNLIHTAGKALVADMLRDESGYDTGLTYLALSTDSTSPVAGDTLLAGEVFRKAFSSKLRSSNVLTYSSVFIAAESTYNIAKIGVFGHSTATATVDTGVMFSSALVPYDNSSGTVDIVVEYALTIG